MQLRPETLYHIYNRGNNQQRIFLQEKNYGFFMSKAWRELNEQLDFLAYCLMPNHFHFLVYTKPSFELAKFSSGMRTLLSSYTRAIQKQQGFTGSLFQQNTKYKELNDDEYALTCFHYIHQNPLKARLVSRIEDWPHHSFDEYTRVLSPQASPPPVLPPLEVVAGLKGGICNTDLAKEILNIPLTADHFYRESYAVINEPSLMETDGPATTWSGGRANER
jgi:REP element-mobilizing transposase RayT